MSSVRGNVCVYETQRAFAVYMDTHARRLAAGVHEDVCVRARMGACVCMKMCARPCIPFLPLLSRAHAGARKRSNVRGVHDSLAPGILSRSRRPACGPPPYPPRLVPPFYAAPFPSRPTSGSTEDPFTCTPRALCLASLRGPLSFSPPASRIATLHTFADVPPPLTLLRAFSLTLSRIHLVYAHVRVHRAAFAHARIDNCVRAARTSRGLFALSCLSMRHYTTTYTCALPPRARMLGPVEHERARVRI